MGIVITMIILVVGGWFLWMKVIQPQMSKKYAGNYDEAIKEFEANQQAIHNDYFTDPQKFALLRQVMPEGEEIVGIAAYMAPKSIGKSLLEEAKTSVTRVRKVDMSLYYMILTPSNLHAVQFNGENSVDHTVFDLDTIFGFTVGKGGGLNAKDMMTGVQGDFHKLSFSYKDKKYSYNLYKYVYGFPVFEVKKDSISENFYHVFPAYGEKNAVHDRFSKEYHVDMLFRQKLYDMFKAGLETKFGVTFPG